MTESLLAKDLRNARTLPVALAQCMRRAEPGSARELLLRRIGVRLSPTALALCLAELARTTKA